MTFKKLFVSLTGFTLLIALITFVAMQFVNFLNPFTGWAYLLILVYLINLASLYLLQKYSEKRSVKFVNVFMLTSFGRMMLYIIIMLIYVYLKPSMVIPFVVVFLFYFMSYLIFEVTVLLKLNKKSNFR